MGIFSENPISNPNAYKNKTITINNGSTENDKEKAQNKLKCLRFINALKLFIETIFNKNIKSLPLIHKVPVKILSEQDINGKVLVTTLLGETDSNFYVLNKSGERVSSGEYGYIFYTKSLTNSWLAIRNGKPIYNFYREVTEEQYNELVRTENIDEDMFYIFIDDDETIY